jgi:hypothetical protein
VNEIFWSRLQQQARPPKHAIGRISPSPFAYSGHAFSTLVDGPMLLSPQNISRAQDQKLNSPSRCLPNLAKRSLDRLALSTKSQFVPWCIADPPHATRIKLHATTFFFLDTLCGCCHACPTSQTSINT